MENTLLSKWSVFAFDARGFLLLLSQPLQMPNVSTKRLSEGIFVIVSDTKLLTRLTNNGSYLWIVDLTHTREQVMSCLMIQGACENVEKPAIRGVILSCLDLQFSPILCHLSIFTGIDPIHLADNVGSLETKSQPIAGNHVRNNEQADHSPHRKEQTRDDNSINQEK